MLMLQYGPRVLPLESALHLPVPEASRRSLRILREFFPRGTILVPLVEREGFHTSWVTVP